MLVLACTPSMHIGNRPLRSSQAFFPAQVFSADIEAIRIVLRIDRIAHKVHPMLRSFVRWGLPRYCTAHTGGRACQRTAHAAQVSVLSSCLEHSHAAEFAGTAARPAANALWRPPSVGACGSATVGAELCGSACVRACVREQNLGCVCTDSTVVATLGHHELTYFSQLHQMMCELISSMRSMQAWRDDPCAHPIPSSRA